jgi:exopolysaccharide biosynthesis predicted pyruvyltransferase EpsI
VSANIKVCGHFITKGGNDMSQNKVVITDSLRNEILNLLVDLPELYQEKVEKYGHDKTLQKIYRNKTEYLERVVKELRGSSEQG